MRAVCAALAIWAALPFAKLPALLRRIEAERAAEPVPEPLLKRRIDAANKLSRFPLFVIRNNCLKRSLLLYYTLLISGVRGVRIHIGVHKRDEKLDGHAWLTVGGDVFADTEEFVSKYRVIYSSGENGT